MNGHPEGSEGRTVPDGDGTDQGTIQRFFREGVYPYADRLSRSAYEREKALLQIELLKVQRWARESNERIVILFEGRDAAGKGGTIKRFMEHLNPRGARVVALEKPSEAERGQGTSNAMSRICRLTARSFCSTAPGTTGPVSSA